MWTSISHESALSLTAHQITRDFVLERYTPNCHPFDGQHTGENIAEALEELVQEIKTKCTIDSIKEEWMTNDQGSNMRKAMELLSAMLHEYNCCDHIIHNMVRTNAMFPYPLMKC